MTTVMVIPQFESMFQNFGPDLPPATLLAISISQFMVTWWWVVILLTIALIIGFYWLQGRSVLINRILINLPFTSIMSIVAAEKFSTNLYNLIQEYELGKALEMMAQREKNVLYRKALKSVKNYIVEGNTLGVALMRTNAYPKTLYSCLDVHIDNAESRQLLYELSKQHQQRANKYLWYTKLFFEFPCNIIFLAIAAILALLMYLPISHHVVV